jgi:hypothetical protein
LPGFADLEDDNMQHGSSISGPLKSTYVQPLVDVQNSAEISTNYYVQYKFPLDNFHLQDPNLSIFSILQIEPDTKLNLIAFHPQQSLYLVSNQNVAGEI